MDRLESMAVFVKATDVGSFTAAAAALGLSSQMVGKHVGFLEARLGARLLSRTTRRQSLTAIGAAFYDRCRAILAEAEAAEALVHDLSTTPRGCLKINAPVTFGAGCLAPLVCDYLRDYPDIEVDLSLTDRFVDVVEEGFDVVFRLGALKDSSLVSRALRPFRLVACASPAYLARRGTPRKPGDLRSHDCLGYVFATGRPFAEWRFEQRGNIHEVEVRSRFRVNDSRALHDAALAGHGIMLQSELVVRDDLASGRLVEVLPDFRAPSRAIHLLFPAGRPQMPKLRTFVDRVTAAFG